MKKTPVRLREDFNFGRVRVQEVLDGAWVTRCSFPEYVMAINYVRSNWQDVDQARAYEIFNDYKANYDEHRQAPDREVIKPEDAIPVEEVAVMPSTVDGISKKEFGYCGEDGEWLWLNWELAEHKKVSPANRWRIVELHQERIDIWRKARATRNPRKLGALAVELEKLEYSLQAAWGFDANPDFHTWWYKIPGCTCPKMDNADPMFHGRRIYAGGCPVHNPKGKYAK